jgi:hypothetical protein
MALVLNLISINDKKMEIEKVTKLIPKTIFANAWN